MVAVIDFTSKDKEICLACGQIAKRKTYDHVCSKKCLDYLLDYNNISIPTLFVKNIFLHCSSEEERNEQLTAYANRHSYDKNKVIKKANNIYTNLVEGIRNGTTKKH
jgi:hypothetical protein